jgi:uncharacterized protein (TIGR02147 family)
MNRTPKTRNFSDYRQFIVEELSSRQKRNRSYSLRAFSRDLGISSSRLSEVINGKTGLSEERALGMTESLGLNESEKSLFMDLVQSQHGRSSVARKAALARLQSRSERGKKIENEQFSLISDWQNLALIELLYLDGIEHSPKSFARQLGLPVDVVKETIQRLSELGYIKLDETGKWTPCDPSTSADSTAVPSSAIRQYHRQILDKAKMALDKKPAEERDFSSMVFAFNSRQMEHARNRIRDFRRTLVTELEEIPGKDAVFCLSLQFFELTEK